MGRYTFTQAECFLNDGMHLVLLVRRWHRMVFVMDAPNTVYLAEADSKPKLEATRRERATECGRPATHDGNRKGDGVADVQLEFFDIEGLDW